jgi:ABC-type nitrate/sulfonate/bicarbonate transport system substrate-binding protein
MMKAIFTRTALALVAVVTLLASAQAESLRTIRIGVPDQSAGSKPFIAGPVGMAFIRHQLEAVFKPQGVEVQWQFFKGAGPAVNEALANRQLDFVYLGDLAAIIGKANGLPTRLLLGSRGSESYLAVTRASGIKQLADLKGNAWRSIAVPQTSWPSIAPCKPPGLANAICRSLIWTGVPGKPRWPPVALMRYGAASHCWRYAAIRLT